MIARAHLETIFSETIYNISELGTPTLIAQTQSTTEAKPIITISPEELAFNEKCKNNIWIWVSPADDELLSASELNFITKILAALKMSVNEVAIFVPNELKHSFFQSNTFKGKVIINFGYPIKLIESATTFDNYIIDNLKNANYLQGALLSVLEHDITQKTALWKQLQVLFKISKG